MDTRYVIRGQRGGDTEASGTVRVPDEAGLQSFGAIADCISTVDRRLLSYDFTSGQVFKIKTADNTAACEK